MRVSPRTNERRPPAANALSRIVICSVRSDLSVAEDLQLTRAALIYADEVVLLSPVAAALHQVLSVAEGGEWAPVLDTVEPFINAVGGMPEWDTMRAQVPMFDRYMKMTDKQLALEFARTPKSQNGAMRKVVSEVRAMRATSAQLMQQVGDAVSNVAGSSDIAELRTAAKSGLLKVVPVGFGNDDAVAEYVGTVLAAFLDPCNHLLLDGAVAGVVNATAAMFGHAPGAESRSRRAQIGAGLLGSLPSFEHMPMDAILEVRAEVLPHVTRFRAATFDFETQMSDVEPHSPELDVAIHDLWTATVAPELEELNAAILDNSTVRKVGLGILKSPADLKTSLTAAGVGTGVGVTIGSGHSLLGAIAGLLAAGAPALADKLNADRTLSQHRLMLLHEVQNRAEQYG